MRAERTRELLAKHDITTADRERLSVALRTDISDLKCQLSWVNCVAIATPGLEMLDDTEIKASGLEFYSQTDLLVRYCTERGYSHLGLLGTEWDVNDDSPLVQTLKQKHFEIYTPELEHRASVSACAVGALRGWIQYQGRVLEGSDYCAEAVGQIIHNACGLMNALVICNPELRPLIPILKAKRRQFFATTPIIDLPSLYWGELAKISQSQEKPSG